ncbi:MAG: hypothetical protein O7E52_02390 [Candidatus Poribacteria bacterium]|nr:hypothetical protein [Candidatus Poribacteria bacterium]
MKTTATVTAITICLALICGCQQAFKEAFIDSTEIDEQLVNYALPENGTAVFASEDNPDHPISTLADGITGLGDWDAGEGWEAYFDGPYEYGRYTGYGENAWFADRQLLQQNLGAMRRGQRVNLQERVDPRDFEDEDFKARGLSRLGAFGATIPSAMGWIVFELPEEKLITRAIIHTVDSEKYPASQYGVSDLVVQYWAPQAKGWNNVDRLNKKVGDQHDSIRNNKAERIVVRFRPVRTSKIRIVIRLTNDTETYRKTRYYRYMRGTIRLTEIEIYGLEKKHEAASVTTSQAEADEQLLDEIFVEAPTAPFPEAALSEPTPPATEIAGDEPETQIEGVVQAYASAYSRRNLSALMATISPNYLRDGEDYQQLKDKMDGLFQKYTRIDLSLQRLRIQPETGTATVEADYIVTLASAAGSPATISGKLFFRLIESDDGWQITQIDTQRR